MTAKIVRHSTALARNKAGRETLNIYALASRQARQPETAKEPFLVAQSLCQALGRRARKPKAERPEPTAE